jgi:RluA family pseudouridine synthase
VEVLLDDAELLAVNKPAGQLVIPDRSGRETLAEIVAQLSGGDPTLRIVHRLDRDTSGVLLLARTIDAQRALSAQFEAHTVEKSYLALVRGVPAQEAGVVDLPLWLHPGQRKVVVSTTQGKPARTRFVLLERLGPASLLRCSPESGRQHQIRVHLQAIGLPLLCDPLYAPASDALGLAGRSAPERGAPAALPSALYLSSLKPGYRRNARREERPLLARLSLHAEAIAFDHPRDGGRRRIEAPLPKDLRATLHQLRQLAGRR